MNEADDKPPLFKILGNLVFMILLMYLFSKSFV